MKNEVVLPAKLASKEAGAGLPPVIPEGMRALSVRVNEVIGVAGYVLPGTRVDVAGHGEPEQQPAGRHLEGDSLERAGPDRRHAHRAGPGQGQADAGDGRHAAGVSGPGGAPCAGEHRRQDSARAAQPAGSQGAPETPGIRPGNLIGAVKAPTAKTASNTVARKAAAGPVTQTAGRALALPTVEIIRGDKRTAEVISRNLEES